MGLQGPLTAQALGRSPYDDVVPGSADSGSDSDENGQQQYDYRGRPVNPDSKRINRDIIRAHNQVMLVVGVAEPENPQPEPEADSKRQHHNYEEGVGSRLIWTTKRCIEVVGIFGVTGARQRILVYSRFSHIPFWDLFRAAKADFSLTNHVLSGAPSGLAAAYIDRRCYPPWLYMGEETLSRRLTLEAWTYLRSHLELYSAFQRLGLISNTHYLPSWKYFIPFTADSPIPPPPPLEDLSAGSLLRWFTRIVISAGPFILWAATQRVLRDWKPHLWQRVIYPLPSPIFGGRPIGPLPPPPPPPPAAASTPDNGDTSDDRTTDNSSPRDTEVAVEDISEESNNPQESGADNPSQNGSYSNSGPDDYDTEDGEHDVVSATLISFDVEASEPAEVPQGLWSAELRPSAGSESNPLGAPITFDYLSTMLTKLPSLMAAKLLNDALLRILITPYEAVSLRLAAVVFRLNKGLPISDIQRVAPLAGFNLTWLANFLGVELIHLALSGEVWAFFALVSQYFHMSEEEWAEYQGTNWGERLGKFRSGEPLF